MAVLDLIVLSVKGILEGSAQRTQPDHLVCQRCLLMAVFNLIILSVKGVF